ncbi:MAG TPA: hypothetical protein VL475_06215 [Planctomycetaceae bacterium]|nr:hypothetical protein [Planctomycetaceae bacterium]
MGRRASPPPELAIVDTAWPEFVDVSRPDRSREILFGLLWVFISLVSAIDVYLTVRFHETLPELEQNPFGLMLLEMSDWNPSLLIGVKFMGTTLVLGFLTTLYAWNRRLGLTVTAAVGVFQCGLLWYLLIL